MQCLIDAIISTPRDRGPQLVYADWLEEAGRHELANSVRRFGLFEKYFGDGGDGGGGFGGGDGDDSGFGGGGFGGGGGGDGGDSGGGDGGFGGDGGGDSGFGGGGFGGDDSGDSGGLKKTIQLSQGFTMIDGNLYIISTPSGYYPWVVIGWYRAGDLTATMRNCRVIRRYGSRAQLAVIAQKGPQRDTELLAASEEEEFPVQSISRIIPCDPKSWAKECPKPE
jgi:uncharacterized protein (TIGR02996 family)